MTSNAVANVTDYDTGLEDFDASEASIPRISILHASGVFKDNQTGEENPILYAVILGLIKQRTMWPAQVEDDTRPMCKSNDAEYGFPNVKGPADSLFPWEEYGMTVDEVAKDEFGRPTIACGTCPFKEWTVGKANKNVPPRCSERHSFPMLYSTEADEAPSRAGIVSFQRSGIGPSKAYLSGFKRGGVPLFSVITKLALDLNRRGQVTYSVPSFSRFGKTREIDWESYAKDLRGIREILRRPPRPDEDAIAAGPLPVAQPRAATPAAASAPVGAEVKPAAASVVDAASQPIVTTVIATPAPVATPAPAAASVADDDDDLPF